MDSAESAASTRRPRFIKGEADIYSGFSVNSHRRMSSPISSAVYCNPPQRMRNLAVSPRSVHGRGLGEGFDERIPHFLDACYLCKQQLSSTNDIYMYRGNIPFCSIECRQEQIEMDEAREKSSKLSVSMRALRKKEQNRSSSPSKSPQDCRFNPGTVAAA